MREKIDEIIHVIPTNNYPHWILDFKIKKSSDEILQEIEEKVFNLRVEDSIYVENQKGLFSNKIFNKGYFYILFFRRYFMLLLWRIID